MANRSAYLGVHGELRTWAEVALDRQWRVEKTPGGHIRWLPPDGKTVIITATTPGCRRGILNTRSMLRRAGLPV